MKKYLIISMIILSSSLGLAGENEDFKYVDNLYREKDFKNALPQSEKFYISFKKTLIYIIFIVTSKLKKQKVNDNLA